MSFGMRILVLGGTVFLSHAIASEAVSRGHEVVCAARGKAGTVPRGARLVRVDRDVPGSLGMLADDHFDAVVDVARMSYSWVTAALRTIQAAHWTFVSTINVYSDEKTLGLGPGAPLRAPVTAETNEQTPEEYSAIKVASENAVRETFGDRAFIVRPGLITGPGDPSDRFGYWPARFFLGGRVLVPESDGQPIQHIDVRDLATWIVDGSEQRLAGNFDAVGPRTTLTELLDEIATECGRAEIVRIPSPILVDAGVQPWLGPMSLPLWLPDAKYWGISAHDPSPAADAGLRHRSLGETVRAALGTEQGLGLDRPRKAGLSPEEETQLLRGFDTGGR